LPLLRHTAAEVDARVPALRLPSVEASENLLLKCMSIPSSFAVLYICSF
jgi:hypothetical protein